MDEYYGAKYYRRRKHILFQIALEKELRKILLSPDLLKAYLQKR